MFALHKRNRLPHWDVAHGIQFVTWHLADALPRAAIESLRREREYERQRLMQTRGSVTKADVATLDVAFRRECERLLDGSQGECVLRDHRAAKIVAEAIIHFDEERYRLLAWCVMPNHVHVVLSTELPLAEVLHSWKSFTRVAINKMLGRRGKLDYVLNNPAEAGLIEWPFVKSYPDRLRPPGGTPGGRGRDARTPA